MAEVHRERKMEMSHSARYEIGCGGGIERWIGGGTAGGGDEGSDGAGLTSAMRCRSVTHRTYADMYSTSSVVEIWAREEQSSHGDAAAEGTGARSGAQRRRWAVSAAPAGASAIR